MSTNRKFRHRLPFSTLAEAQAANFVLFEGERWTEKDPVTGFSTGRQKVGDGVETSPGSGVAVGTAFNDLPFEPGGTGGGDAASVDFTPAGTIAATNVQAAIEELDNDARMSNSRTPTPHASSHGSGGSDAITVAQSQVTGLGTALAGKENTGVAAAAVTAHEGASDPHPQYLTVAEGNAAYGNVSRSGSPVAGQAAEWASGTAIAGVGTTGTGNYVKATAPALSAATVSTEAAVTAGTNAQGQAPLTADLNVVTTAANNPSGVTLPAATVGRRVVILNLGANNVNIYPASGGSIDVGAVNTSLQLPINARLTLDAISTTLWRSSRFDRQDAGFLTGTGTGVNNALAVAVGSPGAFVVLNGAGGTPSALTLTNATGLPIAGLTGLGTGIAAALAVNTGSAGAPVLFGGAGGTPSALTLTNATGLPPGGLTMATARLLGRSTAGSGVAEEISIGTNLTLSGGVLSASGGGATNLSILNRGTTTLDVASDTGTDATIPAATTSLTGLLTSADKTKLDGIATGATANATDAALRDRATHTGTQGVATITGLGSLATLSALGNITSAGAIGSTATLPVITTTGGVLTTGTFGTIAGSFCQGNDSRLSDARTPTAHTHGNITNAGAIGSTANLPIITGTGGVLQAGSFGTTANTFCQGNDSRLTTDLAYTPSTRLLASSTGADVTLPLFGSTDAGLTPASGGGTSNFLRADGTWAAPGGGGSTNLTYTASTRVIASDTGTDATLPLVSSGDAGLAPASGGGTTNFLRADGTWAAPAGGGGSSGPSLGLTLAIAYGLVPF